MAGSGKKMYNGYFSKHFDKVKHLVKYIVHFFRTPPFLDAEKFLKLFVIFVLGKKSFKIKNTLHKIVFCGAYGLCLGGLRKGV